jgi:hypothetical protein
MNYGKIVIFFDWKVGRGAASICTIQNLRTRNHLIPVAFSTIMTVQSCYNFVRVLQNF